MISVLFTRSDAIGSKLIRAVTKEPVSHCALYSEEWDEVLHATEGGIQCVTLEEFTKINTVVMRLDVDLDEEFFDRAYYKYLGKGYDYLALVFLGIRYVLKSLHLPCPKVNLWNASGLFLCTELVSEVTLGSADSLITPYQLYRKLKYVDSH